MSDIIYTPPAAASGPTGSGAAGQVTFWSAATVLSGSNNLFWDNTNSRLGIGTVTPGVKFDIHGTGVIQQLNGTTTNNSYLDFQNAGSTKFRIGNTYNAGQNRLSIFNAAGTTEIITAFQTGNWAINSIIDAGFKLDVNGTCRIQGNLTTVTGSWDSTGIAVNNIRRNAVASLVINTDGSVSQSLQFTATSAWGGSSSGSIYGLINTMQFAGTGTSSFIYFGFTGTVSTSTSSRLSIIEISNSITTTNASSIVRGFFYNPTATIAGFNRAIETVIGDSLFGTTSGSVGIGANTTIDASAILDIKSTTKGFLPPRMTNAQRTAIATPAVGLVVYCTDATEGLYIYKSTGWTFII